MEKLNRLLWTNRVVVIPRSERDRWGALGHPKFAEIKKFRESPHRRRLLIALAVACPLGFAAPFVVTPVLDQLGSTPDREVLRSQALEAVRHFTIPICSRWDYVLPRRTCLVDGDTGWEWGVKWRLSDVDTPEISSPGCPGELQKGLAARDRLQRAMSGGYTIAWLGRTDRYGRELVDIRLRNGWDAGRLLLSEGLARPFPNSQKAWCSV
jgi:endonuclease YncB( thermonuclease family)